jgi:glycerol uptake facilitator-like aquaporin
VTARAAIAEGIATAFLLIAVVGSGIMAERLSGGNVALALLANALATGGALFALIVTFAHQTGAHMNPLVTIMAAADGDFRWRAVPAYMAAQIVGAIGGVWIAHAMFAMPILEISRHQRSGIDQWIAEAVATLGLLIVIKGAAKLGVQTVAGAVAAYITGAYWFTASTSFANPAVTLARSLTDSFAGIRPLDAPGFILAQMAGALLALAVVLPNPLARVQRVSMVLRSSWSLLR